MKKRNIFLSFGAFILYSVLIFALITSICMIKLNEYLEEYEAYQPTTVNDTVFEMFENKNAEALYMIKTADEKLDSAVFPAYLDKVTDKDSLFAYKASSNENEIAYDYISNNKKVATLTLTKSGNKSKLGFDEYVIRDIDWHKLFEYTITVPDACSIYVNRKELDLEKLQPESVVVRGDYTDFDGTSFLTSTYRIDYLEYITDIKVESPYSECLKLVSDDEFNYVYTYEMPDDLKQDITEIATSAAKAYILYTTKAGVPVGSVLPYVHKNAALYNNLKNFNNTWNYNYYKDDYKKFDMTDFKFYDQNKASCKVSAIYTIWHYWVGEKDFDFDYEMYFVKDKENWYLTAMERVAKADE